MILVIFEVWPRREGRGEYLDLAATLKPLAESIPGFVSIERFQSLSDEGKLLSISVWESEDAIARWHQQINHRDAQRHGKETLFRDFRIRVAAVSRDYSMAERVSTALQDTYASPD